MKNFAGRIVRCSLPTILVDKQALIIYISFMQKLMTFRYLSGAVSSLAFVFTMATLGSFQYANASVLGENESECFGPEIVDPVVKTFGRVLKNKDGLVCKADNPFGYRYIQVFDTMSKFSFQPKAEGQTDELSMGRISNDWTEYVHGKTLKIQLSNDNCENVYAGFADTAYKTIQLCPRFYDTDKTDLMDAIGTLMHEAAHLRTYKRHVKCTAPGEYQGTDVYACDESLSAGGAYAVSVEMYAQFATRINNISPVAKSVARSRAISYALTRFNQKPYLKQVKHPYILTQKGQLAVYEDRSGTITSSGNSRGLIVPGFGDQYLLIPTVKNGKFAGRSGARMNTPLSTGGLFDGMKPLIGDSSVVGVHLGAKMKLVVRKKSIEVVCLGDQPGSTFAKNSWNRQLFLNGDGFVGLQYPNGFEIDSPAVTVLTTSGLFGEVTCNSDGHPRFNDDRPSPFPGLKKVMKIGDDIFGMTFDAKFVQVKIDEQGTAFYRQRLAALISDFTEMTDYVYIGDVPQAEPDSEPVDIPTVCIHCSP